MMAGALLVWAGAAAAAPPDTSRSDTAEASDTITANYIDLTASLGFSSAPQLGFNNSSSIFGRIAASGVHSWSTERSSTSIQAYVDNTTYFHSYGSQQIFDVSANTNFAASPTVSLFGGANFSGDVNGQLSNRFLSNPAGPPPVTSPGNPLPPPSVVPDVLGFNGRNYRLSGQFGASILASERSTVSLSAGGQHSWFTGNSVDNYTSFFGSVGYSHLVSERTGIGATLHLNRQDYTRGGWANVVNPTLTAHSQLSETLSGDAAVGVLYIEQKNLGFTTHDVSPSFSGSLCNSMTLSRWCVRVARDASSALDTRIANLGTRATIHTILAADYYRSLSPYDTIQAQLTATRYSGSSSLPGTSQSQSSTYISGVLGYDRKIGHRLAAGVQGGARKLYEIGPDRKVDVNANVYIRYRLGDIQ
jgi:hypothetical protein